MYIERTEKNERKKKKRKTLNKLRIHVSRIFKEFETNEKMVGAEKRVSILASM